MFAFSRTSWTFVVLVVLVHWICPGWTLTLPRLGLGIGTWLDKHGLYPGERCGFVKDPTPVDALEDPDTGLLTRVLAQESAVKTIVSAFETKSSLSGGSDKTAPLFLYFAGPTGVGKTWTAEVIAEIIQDSDRGPIEFFGEFYSDEAQTIEFYQHRIQSKLYDVMRTCGGKHVVIFDEIQKVAPKVLDTFRPILEHGSFDFVTDGNKVRTAVPDSKRVVRTSSSFCPCCLYIYVFAHSTSRSIVTTQCKCRPALVRPSICVEPPSTCLPLCVCALDQLHFYLRLWQQPRHSRRHSGARG